MPDVTRDEKGRLVKGTASLNPGGRPKGVSAYIKERYGHNLELLLEKLIEVLESTNNEKLKADIIERLIDRVEGKPVQHQKIESDNTITIGEPIKELDE